MIDISESTSAFVECTLWFWCNQRIRKFQLHETFYYWWNGKKPWNLNIAQCTFAVDIASHQNKNCLYTSCLLLLYFFYWLLFSLASCTVGPPDVFLLNYSTIQLVQLLDVIQQPRLLVEAGSGRLCSIRDVSILTKEKCSNKKSMNLKNALKF